MEERRRYLIGERKDIEGYDEKQFVPYNGAYDNWSYDKQELIDLKAVLGDENLEIIQLSHPQTMVLDLSGVKSIRIIE